MVDLGDELRARGMRLTTQRVRVLEALRTAGHATADRVAEVIAGDGGPPLSASTIYRNLDALQELGLVTHTHVDHRAPEYHLAGHATHIHLYCRGCGRTEEVAVAEGADFVGRLRRMKGFRADLTHSAVHGLCATCVEPIEATAEPGKESP